MDFPENATSMEVLGPAMEVTDQAEADAYFEAMLRHVTSREPRLDREVAEKNLRDHIGYWAGYYSHETRLRVERLFRCEHPVFGPAAKGPPGPEEAFRAGVATRRALVEGRDEGEAMQAGRDVVEAGRDEG